MNELFGPFSRITGVTAIRTALETAGVEFIPENGGGAGVRLRKASATGSGGAHDARDPAEPSPAPARRSVGPEDEDRADPEAPED